MEQREYVRRLLEICYATPPATIRSLAYFILVIEMSYG